MKSTSKDTSDLRISPKSGNALALLRDEMRGRSLDGIVVPRTDEHLSEFIGDHAERLAWLSGFTGSAGCAVVLHHQAVLFTDGRYALQARRQVDGDAWHHAALAATSVTDWLIGHCAEPSLIGYDPQLHSWAWIRRAKQALSGSGIELAALATNPIDAIWTDQPERSSADIDVWPIALAGVESSAKRAQIAIELSGSGASSVMLCALDSIAWALNIRGRDIAYTPVALAHAAVHSDGTADLFVDPGKTNAALLQHLGEDVRIHSSACLASWLTRQAGQRICLDPDRTPAAIADALEQAGAFIVEAPDPAVLPKAIKNATEIEGHRSAQLLDSCAVARFLCWLSVAAASGAVTELSASRRLHEFRKETGCLRDLSTPTISASGPNAALIHYVPSEVTNRALLPGELFLIDSGGQYPGGTTDVTRTVAIGAPNDEMRRRFTQVLKGHIALATAIFPEGTRGSQLDVLARQFLWAAGVDFAHGTGHGVGACLAIHEGPQRIAKVSNDAPLHAGMLLTNEPGYYKAGAFGIRIESILLVVPRAVDGAEETMLGFETLTLVPIDRRLIAEEDLTDSEIGWIDAYHARVADALHALLDEAEQAWLIQACRPLRSDRHGPPRQDGDPVADPQHDRARHLAAAK